MLKPTRHIVVDTNILLAYLAPTDEPDILLKRVNCLFSACLDFNWPLVKLHIPTLCLAEGLCGLDRIYYQKTAISEEEYKKKKEFLFSAIHRKKIETIPFEPIDTFYTSYISPANSSFDLHKKDGFHSKSPMGAADCLLAAQAYHLATKIGVDSVFLVTNDFRFLDVLEKCKKLTRHEADLLHFKDIEEMIYKKWAPEHYPIPINFSEDPDQKLDELLGGWPLLSQEFSTIEDTPLTTSQRESLCHIFASTFKKTISIDDLLCTTELQRLQLLFAKAHGFLFPEKYIVKALLYARKNSELKPIMDFYCPKTPSS